MKKYIFITYGIINMGGGQMYLRNKMLYLRQLGYDVYIISAYKGTIILKEFLDYEKLITPDLMYPCIFYSTKTRDRIINSIIEKIDYTNGDEIIVESNDVVFSTWGEILAARLKGKHFIYIIAETSYISRGIYLDFLNFKFSRKEIAGVTNKTLERLFGTYKNLGDNERYNLFPHCMNVVDDYPHEITTSLPKCDFTIGSIGRLAKPYILPMLEDLKKFAIEFSESTFNILLIGGEHGNSKVEEKIYKMFENVSNVTLTITGYLFPVPLTLLERCDLFISSAGSALVSHDEGFLTISIDGNDLNPIGVMGYTTNNYISREDEIQVDLKDLLVDILIDKKYPSRTVSKKENYKFDFKEHLGFIENSATSLDYFNISKTVLPLKETIKYFVYRVLDIRVIAKFKTILKFK